MRASLLLDHCWASILSYTERRTGEASQCYSRRRERHIWIPKTERTIRQELNSDRFQYWQVFEATNIGE
jgi:hypothetical protein